MRLICKLKKDDSKSHYTILLNNVKCVSFFYKISTSFIEKF